MAGKTKTKKTEPAEMSFEAAMARLDEIIAKLDTGEAPLEESLALFGEGAELVNLCGGKLEKARLTVETLFPGESKEKKDV